MQSFDSTTQAVVSLSLGESESYAFVKGTSAVSMLKDLGVDISQHTQIDQAVLEVRTGDSE